MPPEINQKRLINQLREEDRAAHDWYRFVLSYPPHLVREYLHRFDLPEQAVVLDPFCGTGTTVVECKKYGVASVGVEVNPMAWFAGTVKLDWSLDPEALLSLATQVGDAATAMIAQTPDPPWCEFAPEATRLILANSISPLPLHKALMLESAIQAQITHPASQHLLLALAKAVVNSGSNLRFRPEVGVVKPKTDAPVVAAWWQEIVAIANDLRLLQALQKTPATIHWADARHLLPILQPESIDAVITSPPYPNEKDYTRTTRLELVLLGLIQNKADLRFLKQGLVRSNSRNVYIRDRDDLWVLYHPEIQRVAQDIEAQRLALGKTSGFARLYPRTVRLYFGGMARHLGELRHFLKPGASLAYVVGDQRSYLQVLVKTGALLASIAESLGYEVMGIDLFRKRLSATTQEEVREEVLLLRWPGVMPADPNPFSFWIR